jgi:SAM-dependent methyltransferase
VETWHYGLVARYWAEFNVDGPEIDYFRQFVEGDGQPALDVACGTGRLLIPYLRDGLDVDGCDVSADMIALCSEKASAERLTTNLYVQPMHALDLPRRYRTIFVCGGFGLGSDREQDVEALRRFHDHLEPGGTLVIDIEVPYAQADVWQYWPKQERARLPEEWPPWRERRRASDGAEYGLRVRVVSIDPWRRNVTFQIQTQLWRDGELVAEEERTLDHGLYFGPELLLMLDKAGFSDIVVKGDHSEQDPTSDQDFLVFIARKPV